MITEPRPAPADEFERNERLLEVIHKNRHIAKRQLEAILGYPLPEKAMDRSMDFLVSQANDGSGFWSEEKSKVLASAFSYLPLMLRIEFPKQSVR